MVPVLFFVCKVKKPYFKQKKWQLLVNWKWKTLDLWSLVWVLMILMWAYIPKINSLASFIFFGCIVKIMCFKQKMWYVSITEKWKKLDLWFLAWTLAIFMRVFMQKISHLALFTFSGHTVKKALNKIHHGAISKCWNSQVKGAEYLYIHIYIYIYSIYIYRYTHEILLALLVDL